MRSELLDKLYNHKVISDDESFEIASEICTLINSADTEGKQKGRDIIIRLLDNWDNLAISYRNIFADLVLAAGFYPYLNSVSSTNNDFDEEVRIGIHQSSLYDNRFFHSEQKELFDILKSHRNVIVSAPTSFGKSLLIEEIIATNDYRNIVIIQPTLALLDETRRKLKKYSNNYKIIVRTSQQASSETGNIFLLTAERVLEYPDMPKIELLILDEFYKLSNKRGDNRNNVLNTAFVRIMKNPNCRFYLLGPNIDSIPNGFIEKYDAIFFKTNYSLVLTEADDRYESVHIAKGNKVDERDLFTILDELKEQTLVYCSSPRVSRKLAFRYCEHLINKGVQETVQLPLVDWISSNLSFRWSLAKCLKYGIAVHDGSMPKHITSSTIQYFNEKRIKTLFCTNTIIEGVNTSAKNVIYYDNKIGPKSIDYFDYSNIRGRAGRLMEHYVGRIINLRKPPEKEITDVDFPFFSQNPIDSEVLVNLEENEVLDINDNISRFKEFREKDKELQELLIRNAVSIEGQEAILKQLEDDLKDPSKRELILWNRIDGKLYKRLSYIFDLCWERLSTPEERRSFGAKGWVVNKIVGSCYQTTTNQMIEKDLEYRAKKLAEEKEIQFVSIDDMFVRFPTEMQERTDNIIEQVFSLQKNWLQYRAPKWINVVDSLQKYAALKLALMPGDYSYVAEMIENEFIDSNFRILLEYGVPVSAIQKIEVLLSQHNASKISEDELIDLIRSNKDWLLNYLSPYEQDIITRAL